MQAISSLCSRDIFGLKILQFDWPRPFRANMTEKQTIDVLLLRSAKKAKEK